MRTEESAEAALSKGSRDSRINLGHCEPSLVINTIVAIPLLHVFMGIVSTLFEKLSNVIEEVSL